MERLPGDINFQKKEKTMKTKKTVEKEVMDLRFQTSLPLQKYRKLLIGIAGLGSIGRQVATLLATMGQHRLYGADPDVVEVKNIGTQGWCYDDVGKYKADVLEGSLTTRHSTFGGFPCRFEDIELGKKSRADAGWVQTTTKPNVVFRCVDTMAARQDIWKQVEKNEETMYSKGLYIDARMIPNVIRIITVELSDKAARDYYRSTLYSDDEAFQGACTDRMTMFGAYIAAGVMVSQLGNWLNEIPLIRDFLLETMRMSVTDLERRGTREKGEK